MPRINSKLIGTAGEHYVAYKLSSMGYVAAIPREGAPTVDILACSVDASKVVSIQVKSTEWAKRDRGRGDNRKLHHLEFPLGHKAARYNNENLIFTFVDLNGLDWDEEAPDVYVVPSTFIYDFCKGWVDGAKMVRFHVRIDEASQFKNNWEPIRKALESNN
ncbi:hypothetical protein [Vibrio mediterranei]|uniref:hypothetical protein n=1 Tax=Vibrio mediterranei TaxID=689 RepID=UPI00148C9126|nr:hypothetical protein [Vibrio mediterranei]NOH31692.1 hypothetical protein [Vibrio mediterranei]